MTNTSVETPHGCVQITIATNHSQHLAVTRESDTNPSAVWVRLLDPESVRVNGTPRASDYAVLDLDAEDAKQFAAVLMRLSGFTVTDLMDTVREQNRLHADWAHWLNKASVSYSNWMYPSPAEWREAIAAAD